GGWRCADPLPPRHPHLSPRPHHGALDEVSRAARRPAGPQHAGRGGRTMTGPSIGFRAVAVGSDLGETRRAPRGASGPLPPPPPPPTPLMHTLAGWDPPSLAGPTKHSSTGPARPSQGQRLLTHASAVRVARMGSGEAPAAPAASAGRPDPFAF